MAESTGKESQQELEVKLVNLGDFFYPFAKDAPRFFSLNIDNKVVVPVEVERLDIGEGEPLTKEEVILPFTPEEGYLLDSDDYTLESRIKKQKRLRKELEKPINKEINFKQLVIVACTGLENPKRLEPFSPDDADLFRRLGVYMGFPEEARGVRFEARIDEWTAKDLRKEPPESNIFFSLFYPVDLGRPVTDFKGRMRDMFFLGLPRDPEKLNGIRMKFFLAPEEKMQNPAPLQK